MILLREAIESLFQKVDYPLKNKYDNEELNRLLNYWLLLEECRSMIQELSGESLETILYSKYYWSSRFIEMYTELYGVDAGLKQQQYKILEEMDQELSGGIDWKIIPKLEEDNF